MTSRAATSPTIKARGAMRGCSSPRSSCTTRRPSATAGEQRDLLQRLRAEIDRAQRLYEERGATGGRQPRRLFQQELVQTLADGDPALLGNV